MDWFEELWNDESWNKVRWPYRLDNLDALAYGYIKGSDKSLSANKKETTERSNYMPTDIRRFIKKVKFNPPATIVFWTDNTKTVVKCKGEDYDPEKGLAMCISKKVLGDKGNYYEVFKKWLPKEEEIESDLPKIAFKPETWTFDLKPIDINKKLFGVLTGTNGKTTIEFKDTKEEPKHNPIEEAYKKLVEHRNGNGEIDLDELIGLLGEALGS